MAIDWSGFTPDEFKMALLRADLDQQYQSWDGWAKLMSDAATGCREHGFAQAFVDEYQPFVDAGDQVGLLDMIRWHQLDNYILGSFAMLLMGVPPEIPAIAYAASNKRSFEGLRGEIANLRALILFGYDVDATTSDGGNTALHSMCGLRWGRGVHVRAIKALLEAGANPNVQNEGGDTAFAYLCGSFPWTEEVHGAATMMLAHGADPELAAHDGSTGLSSLKANQASKDESPARQSVIELIELQSVGGRPKPIKRTAPRL